MFQDFEVGEISVFKVVKKSIYRQSLSHGSLQLMKNRSVLYSLGVSDKIILHT